MSDIVKIGPHTLYLGDCREILPGIGKFDLCLTDPPFGMGNFVQVTGKKRGRGKNYGVPVDWNDSIPDSYIFDLIKEKSKNRIIWGANFFNCFEKDGGAIVWVKNQPMPNFSKADIASCTHFKKTEIVTITWHNFEAAKLKETDHPCERPIALYEWCINYMPRSETIIDPFFGSCSVGVADVRLGRIFTGIERERKYFDIACERIARAHAQGRIFEEVEQQPEQEQLWQ